MFTIGWRRLTLSPPECNAGGRNYVLALPSSEGLGASSFVPITYNLFAMLGNDGNIQWCKTVTIQRHMKIDAIECGFKYFHNINAIELGTKAYTCIMGIFFSCCCSFFYMFLCCWYSYQSRLAFQLWVCEWGKGGTQVSSQPLTFQTWVLFLRKTCLEFQASTSNTHRKDSFLMGQGWSLRSFWKWFQTRELWSSMVRIHV
jgi:hypothetical protein